MKARSQTSFIFLILGSGLQSNELEKARNNKNNLRFTSGLLRTLSLSVLRIQLLVMVEMVTDADFLLLPKRRDIIANWLTFVRLSVHQGNFKCGIS